MRRGWGTVSATQWRPQPSRSIGEFAWNLEKFNKELTAWAGSALPDEELARAYLATFQPVPALVQLAARLKAHQPVALVGNAAPWMRSKGFALLGIADLFSAEALSCEARARLPDKAVLLKAAAKLGLAPETCLLIQQDPAGLDAAQAAHLQTLHYTNPVMLMAELRRMGLPF